LTMNSKQGEPKLRQCSAVVFLNETEGVSPWPPPLVGVNDRSKYQTDIIRLSCRTKRKKTGQASRLLLDPNLANVTSLPHRHTTPYHDRINPCMRCFVVTVAVLLLICSSLHLRGDEHLSEAKLMMLDPGHFHAALVQKAVYLVVAAGLGLCAARSGRA
jgi:hypothetical protein